MLNKKIILIASNGTNIGKSHLARMIRRSYVSTRILSFADPLKDCCDKALAKRYPFLEKSFKDYYSIRKYKDTPLKVINKDIKDNYKDYTLREFLIKISDNNKKHRGYDCFINTSVIDCKLSGSDIIVFDDFRLPFEYDKLTEIVDRKNILTLYLDKKNSKSKNKNSYEGALEYFNFDLKFTYTEDYNNLEELLDLLENFLDD